MNPTNTVDPKIKAQYEQYVRETIPGSLLPENLEWVVEAMLFAYLDGKDGIK